MQQRKTWTQGLSSRARSTRKTQPPLAQTPILAEDNPFRMETFCLKPVKERQKLALDILYYRDLWPELAQLQTSLNHKKERFGQIRRSVRAQLTRCTDFHRPLLKYLNEQKQAQLVTHAWIRCMKC